MTLTAFQRAQRAIALVDSRSQLQLGERICQEIAYEVIRAQESSYGLPVERGNMRLTGRCHQMLLLAAQGRSNAEICDEFGIALCTVKTHMHLLLKALGARDRAHAVAIGFATGLLKPADVFPE